MIRKRISQKKPNIEKINVSAKIIADISSGIYRTPANALKELISNSFDADATRIIINTGYPNFDVITCSDDGRGMNKEGFVKYMQHIGGSFKREKRRKLTDSGRPIIGKIGIGILGIAQICRKFTVISSKGDGKKLQATIDLKDFHENDAYKKNIGDIRIGTYVPYELPEKRGKHYTKIILEEINNEFKNELIKSENRDKVVLDYKHSTKKNLDPKRFEWFIEQLNGKGRIRDLTEYERLIWELSLIIPIRYLDNGPIRNWECFKRVRDKLKAFNFSVIVDGLELRKPIIFPTDDRIRKYGVDYKIYDDLNFNGEINGTKLKFKGYIFYQRTRILPPELQGILVRIKNVAIGFYDKSFLNYPKPEGPMMAQVSGEIYIEEGLEDALNIDRNSFRESDYHFLKLQQVLFNKLGGKDGIFLEIRKISEERMSNKRKKEEAKDYINLQNIIKRVVGKDFSITKRTQKNKKPIKVDPKKSKIIIYENPIFPRKKSQRRSFEKLLILLELANLETSSKEEFYKKFYELMLKK